MMKSPKASTDGRGRAKLAARPVTQAQPAIRAIAAYWAAAATQTQT